jgi:transketolase
MKGTFFRTLLDVAQHDPAIDLLTGDLGFGSIEPFVKQFPGRFLNVGVAEQNLAGIAAGLALCGRTVFAYSIANFPTLRCLEQIRNDICYHKANVKIVAVGGGFSYGALGVSHYATEDLAILRALPEMLVIAPADAHEVEGAVRAIAAHRGPCYLRLGRSGDDSLHAGAPRFEIGRAMRVREGTRLTIVTTGEMLRTGINVCDALTAHGLSAALLSMHTIKPLDADAVVAEARRTGAVFTIEEHSVIGGLGGAVAEVLAEADLDGPVTFKRFGVPSAFPDLVGTQDYLRERHGLSPAFITTSIMAALAKSVPWTRGPEKETTR